MTTLRDISQAISAAFGVEVADLHGPSRARVYAYPRFAAFHMARMMDRWSLQQIGAHFGGRDHTTVISGVRQASGLLETPEFFDRYQAAKALVGKTAFIRHGTAPGAFKTTRQR